MFLRRFAQIGRQLLVRLKRAHIFFDRRGPAGREDRRNRVSRYFSAGGQDEHGKQCGDGKQGKFFHGGLSFFKWTVRNALAHERGPEEKLARLFLLGRRRGGPRSWVLFRLR